MKILSLQTIHGPNVYHHKPILVMTIDLSPHTEKPSHRIPGFVESLLQLLPGLENHTCSLGTRGGFHTRLREGTYPSHIIEHIAIELSTLAGIPVHFGKTRSSERTNEYRVITCFAHEEGMKSCLKEAVQLVELLIENKKPCLKTALRKIQEVIDTSSLGPTTRALYEAALQRGIPVRRIGENSLLQLGYGKYIRRLQAATSGQTSLIASDIAQDKQLTKILLEQNGIPVPQGRVVKDVSEIPFVLGELTAPYAVKPVDGHQGQGIALHLKSMGEVLRAFDHAQKFSSRILIEEMCKGQDYRVLLVNGKYVAAAKRTPAQITGDGHSTVAELIAKENTNPRRAEGHRSVLTKIIPDEIVIECLAKQGLQLGSVPKEKEQILLRQNANLSCGGTSEDVTDLLPPETRRLCERIARIVDLDICGIDLIHKDITKPLDESLKVLEINASPGLRMHTHPSEGSPRDVAQPILNMLYPPGIHSRIPIISITGTNGKTTVVRLLGKIFL